MATNIILPKTYVPESNIPGPVVFLAGPISGEYRRQNDLIEVLLGEGKGRFTIVSPHQSGSSKTVLENTIDGDKNYFQMHREREYYYMNRARKNGVTAFWLGSESINRTWQTEYGSSDGYGLTTRLELGMTLGMLSLQQDFKVCIGTDEDFSRIDVIQRYMSQQGLKAAKSIQALGEMILEELRK